MSEKVKLRREVVIAIGHYSDPDLDYTKYGVFTCILSKPTEVAIAARKSLIDQYGDSLCWDVLMEALVSGYEIEKTPQDDLKEYYDNSDDAGEQTVIRQTLKLLNIKISGVNTE